MTATHRTGLTVTLLLLLAVLAAAPHGAAVEPKSTVGFGCDLSGAGECSFECDIEGIYAVLYIEVELEGSGSGSVKAFCGSSSSATAECSGAPCYGWGEASNGSGQCKAEGSFTRAYCGITVLPEVQSYLK